MTTFPARHLARTERGASSAEYALLGSLIAGAIVAALIFLGPVVAGLLDSTSGGW